jgi:putative chitinase
MCECDIYFRKLEGFMFHFDDNKLFAGYIAAFPGTPPKPERMAAAGRLIGLLSLDPAIQDIRWAAYMLATVKHECADRWAPITEFGNAAYFHRYDADTPLGHRLGNTQDGDGFRFRGRGYVQITGRANYARLGQLLAMGNQLVQNPDLALDPSVAYPIMSIGMRQGSFTGKKLSDFINPTSIDYVNARRIINGTDTAELIAGYATKLEGVLRSAVVP